MSVPHATSADTFLDGYGSIPKGTNVLETLYPFNNDPKIFPDPRKFDPDRFYDKDADAFRNIAGDKRSIFGLGRRRCLGETLAKAEIFLFTARLVQSFKVTCHPDDVANLEREAVPGVPATPHPFRFVLSERN